MPLFVAKSRIRVHPDAPGDIVAFPTFFHRHEETAGTYLQTFRFSQIRRTGACFEKQIDLNGQSVRIPLLEKIRSRPEGLDRAGNERLASLRERYSVRIDRPRKLSVTAEEGGSRPHSSVAAADSRVFGEAHGYITETKPRRGAYPSANYPPSARCRRL